MRQEYTSRYDLNPPTEVPVLSHHTPSRGKDIAERTRIRVEERLTPGPCRESESICHAQGAVRLAISLRYRDGADGAELPWWDRLQQCGPRTLRRFDPRFERLLRGRG